MKSKLSELSDVLIDNLCTAAEDLGNAKAADDEGYNINLNVFKDSMKKHKTILRSYVLKLENKKC